MDLKDKSLLETRAFIGGEWHEADKTFEVINPATGETITQVADCSTDQLSKAIDLAHAAQKDWAKKTGKERANILRKWFDLMVEHADDLAQILTAEMGKPLAEAKGEIMYGASFIEWFAEEAKRTYGDIIPQHQADKRIVVIQQPIGVVGSITPWNFPNAMIARKVGPALAVGCSVVARPAELTPLSALAMAVLAERAGVPKGVLNIVPSTDAAAAGEELCANSKIRKITFTGSTRVGRLLMKQCAEDIKKVSLELGGNAPFLVFDDADLDAAVEGAVAAKYRNAGQTCVCANRIYVQASVYDEFAEKLAEKVAELKTGNGFEDGVTIGPLINDAAVEKVQNHITDALDHGATVKLGGNRLEGTFFEPTVIVDVPHKALIAREETFGPVAGLIKFDTEEDVIDMANDSEFGLAGYFYTRDLGRVWRVAEAMETGIVGVNTGIISTEVAPFGGIKQSGLGREGSKYGADDFTEIKYICMGGI
ncbi:NAD-dependent succinate-semialdehyde dehydrogenase [Parasulfitobacter algicola]|uniref:NAD-dependent succinate-semialdehyde dehydrogenase n=1 Tax=Parasulfitobacter algicola TaxID=2614809 RepID=A0ABX2IXH3_9RHOB|nr:NAD-dependent succinate-semialdehyde dehydrogenase [Sulfitobacter algicola]NSX55915.1 NAD-dependent succinate-semialdehyde dehydrogenase [Sulfitobacter algicola]